MDENFICLFYLDPSSAEGLAEECKTEEIDCETWSIGKEQNLRSAELSHTTFGYIVHLDGSRMEKLYLNANKPSCAVSTRLACTLFGSEKTIGKHMLYQGISYTIKHTVPCEIPILFLSQNLPITEDFHIKLPSCFTCPSEDRIAIHTMEAEDFHSILSISIVRGMEALDYHKTENLFGSSDARIDVTLLKWIVYLITFFFFLGTLILFLIHFKKCGTSKWTYLFCLLVWLCYLKLEIFSDAAGFPIWILPGKWSDLEGWRALLENARIQLSAIFRFRDYPILCNYYQGLAGCSFSLVLCFLSLWVFLKNARYCSLPSLALAARP